MAKVEIEDTELAELRKQAAAATKAGARADALDGELTKARESLARLPELEKSLAQLQGEKLDAIYQGAGIADPKIRRVFELEWDELSKAEGGPQDLGKWLGELRADLTKAPAHLKPFLTAAGSGAGNGGVGNGNGAGGRGNLPDPNRGAGAGPGADGGSFTAEQILKMTAEELSAAMPAIVKQNPELAGLAQQFTPQAQA